MHFITLNALFTHTCCPN